MLIDEVKVILLLFFVVTNFGDLFSLLKVKQNHHLECIHRYGDIPASRGKFVLSFLCICGEPGVVNIFVVEDFVSFKQQMNKIHQVCNIQSFIFATVDYIFYKITAENVMLFVDRDENKGDEVLVSFLFKIVHVA